VTHYPQKFAGASQTSGGRQVGILRLRTKAMEFSLVYLMTPTAYTASGTKPQTEFTETGYAREKLPKISTGSKMEKHIMYFRRAVSSRIKLL
jgi:hypothetical protein